jgi:hypothetical protein
MSTARTQALALIEREGGDFEESGGPGTLIGSAWAPAGRNWKATSGHSLSVNFHSDRPAGWQALLVEAQRAASAAAAAARQAKMDGWVVLRDRLPFPVVVWHNWTARHLDGYEQGADHIVLLEDLVRPWFRRDKRKPLCWTPSRSQPLRYVHGNTGDEVRVPTCKVCLRWAEKLARPQ